MKREQYWTTQDYRDLLKRWATDISFFGQCAVPRMFKVPSPDFRYEIEEVLKDLSVRFLNVFSNLAYAPAGLYGTLHVSGELAVLYFISGVSLGCPMRG